MRKLLAALMLCTMPAVAHAQQADATQDSIRADRQRHVQALRDSIAGREEQPSREVFRNVKMMGDVPAGRLLSIMDMGYGNSLGVSCDHCHVVDQWDSEQKPQKQVARDMAAMAARINRELLPAVQGLRSGRPTVNCTTCHRGEVKPATNMRPRER